MNYTYIVAPLMGACIGYITNFIAIKMLFRPLEIKYFLGIQLPFTPGIIPREKNRLAKSIGHAVGHKLLTADVILNTITSSYFQEKIAAFIDEKLHQIKAANTKVEDFIHCGLRPDETHQLITLIEKDATAFLYNKLNSPEVVDKLTRHISQGLDDYIEKQLKGNVFKTLLGINRRITDSIKSILTEKIKDVLYADSHVVIENLVEDEIHHILNMPVDNIFHHWEDKIPEIKQILLDAFNRAIRNNIETITATLDLSAMVENKINHFDMEEVETLILGVVEKELKAIIWLGAFLGLIMGLIIPLIG